MSAKDTKEGKSQPGFFSYENLRSLFILIVIILAIRWSCASPYHVPTPSMEPSIKVGDRLLAWKLAYNLKFPFTDFVMAEWGEINRGDIIIFKYPKDTSLDYVKRVVGIAGDRIRLINDVLYLNGIPQERTLHNYDRKVLDDIKAEKDLKVLFEEKLGEVKHWTMNWISELRHPGLGNWPSDGGEYVVPHDSVFVMGDNRDDSQDSRFWNEVPKSYVKGKALFVIWSMYSEKGHLIPSFRFNRFFTWLQ